MSTLNLFAAVGRAVRQRAPLALSCWRTAAGFFRRGSLDLGFGHYHASVRAWMPPAILRRPPPI